MLPETSKIEEDEFTPVLQEPFKPMQEPTMKKATIQFLHQLGLFSPEN